MNHQQALSIAVVQSLAAASREEVMTLTEQLIDDSEHAIDIKNELSDHLESLTMAAEAGELAILAQHIRDIGLLILHSKANNSVQLACLLLQTIDQLSECDDADEIEICEQLTPLIEEFKLSLGELAGANLSESNEASGTQTDSCHTQSVPLNALSDMAFKAPCNIDVDLLGENVLGIENINASALGEDNSSEQLFDDNDLMDALLEGDLDSDMDLLASLVQELTSLQPLLSRKAQKLIAVVGNDFEQTKSEYQELLVRVTLAAVTCELKGLEFVCNFVNDNIKGASEASNEFAEVLAGWPLVIMRHLQAPTSDKECLAVTDYLELTNWPNPLSYRQLRELLVGLTQTAEINGDSLAVIRQSEVTDADVSLEISNDANEELIAAFLAEAPDHAENLTLLIQTITVSHASPEEMHATISAAQRVAHTLKGSAHLLGVLGIANLAHQLEDIFEFLDLHGLSPATALCQSLAQAGDCLEAMMDYLQGHSPAPADAKNTLEQLIHWALLVDSGEVDALTHRAGSNNVAAQALIADTLLTETSPSQDSSSPLVAESTDKLIGELVGQLVNKLVDEPSSSEIDSSTEKVHADTVRVSRELLDNIFNLVGETSIALGQMQEQLRKLALSSRELLEQDKAIQVHRFELENAVSIKGLSVKQASKPNPVSSDDFDSLEMDHYDVFYGVAHSFIEAVEDSRLAMKTLYKDVRSLDNLAVSQQRLNSELQDLVISTRLEPVKSLSNRLHRCVRQACRMAEKNAVLIIEGEELMMDGDMLKQLADPLMHMLRNSVDHGIEGEQNRMAKSKPTQGLITLRFEQRGNQILVRCQDDGQGIDYLAIRKKAVIKGLINEQEDLDDRMLSRLLLRTGFSTRDETSQLSGRGVGMDVVHTTILNLKGTMDIGNSVEGGACITLNLPVTLLTNHSLLVAANKARYAIPSNRLEQILSPGLGRLTMMADKACYQLGSELYPLTTLEHLIYGNNNVEIDELVNQPILLVRGDSETVAVAIDYAISSGELVIKSVGNYLPNVNSVAGLSLLGDGTLVPVLNMSHLLENKMQSFVAPPVSQSMLQLPKVLIVDDSLSVRSALSQLMVDSGYQPLIARDGVEALSLIEKELPQLVLTDLEMPRLNGLELTRHIRKGTQSHTPVIMISSRTLKKHRDQASKVGVNLYLTKPFSEDELIEAIQRQLNTEEQTSYAS